MRVDAWPDERWMQLIAAEIGVSETAFTYPLPGESPHAWALRWFTPQVEDRLCGHATLATAHALHSDDGGDHFRFHTRSGWLAARVGSDRTVTLDFPITRPIPCAPPEGLDTALGARPESVHGTGDLRDLLVVLPDEATVRDLTPDLGAVATLTRRHDIRGIVVTALASDPAEGYDFVSRFFSPADGIPEDPVTGSTHTALAPYWTRIIARTHVVGRQLSARGGLVRTSVRGDRIDLTGTAVTVFDGYLHPEAAPPPN
jgi:predicted PhzF superfamily epimerase YddE/YHI9